MRNKKDHIMGEDTIYVLYTFGITAVLFFMGMNMAYHG